MISRQILWRASPGMWSSVRRGFLAALLLVGPPLTSALTWALTWALCLAVPALARQGDAPSSPTAFEPPPSVTAPAAIRPRHRRFWPRPAYVGNYSPVRPSAPADAGPPPTPPTFFVAIVGDNLASVLGQGLKEALTDRPEIGMISDTHDSSGLVRTDYHDWSKDVHDLLAGPHIDMAVMMIGSNDAQAIQDGATVAAIPSDAWKAIYAKRVDDIATQFKDKHIPLIWIGVPVVRGEKLSSALAFINDIYRSEADKTGATYVDSWGAFVNDQNQFDDYGPDINGQRVRLRTGDGVHFTKAGQRKLAMFAEGPVRQAFDHAKPPVDVVAVAKDEEANANALPPEPTVDINMLIQRESGQAPSRPSGAKPEEAKTLQASLPAVAPPLPAPLVVKPAAGPVIPLTVAPVSADGTLATRKREQAFAPGTEAAVLLERSLIEGRQPDAKPGRADDFTWPRP